MYNDLFQKAVDKYGVFRQDDWDKDKREYQKEFEAFKKTVHTAQETKPVFNFRTNMIDFLQPFVNKRGKRSRLFIGDEHEVKAVQIDTIPGSGKLIYRDIERHISVCEPIYVNSVDTVEKDIMKSAKRLYKKAKYA